jgi:hypothetical protein
MHARTVEQRRCWLVPPAWARSVERKVHMHHTIQCRIPGVWGQDACSCGAAALACFSWSAASLRIAGFLLQHTFYKRCLCPACAAVHCLQGKWLLVYTTAADVVRCSLGSTCSSTSWAVHTCCTGSSAGRADMVQHGRCSFPPHLCCGWFHAVCLAIACQQQPLTASSSPASAACDKQRHPTC